MRIRRTLFVLLLAGFGAGLGPTGALSQSTAPLSGGPLAGPDLEEAVADVASQLRCPVCRQLSVQDSPSDLAVEMKGVIREKLAGGASPDEVKAYFVSKYGKWILLSPPKRGFTLLVWLLPLLALAAGAAGMFVVFRRWMGPEESEA